MIIPVSVKNQSIDSSGITSDYKAAISEYIWNGFEAKFPCAPRVLHHE